MHNYITSRYHFRHFCIYQFTVVSCGVRWSPFFAAAVGPLMFKSCKFLHFLLNLLSDWTIPNQTTRVDVGVFILFIAYNKCRSSCEFELREKDYFHLFKWKLEYLCFDCAIALFVHLHSRARDCHSVWWYAIREWFPQVPPSVFAHNVRLFVLFFFSLFCGTCISAFTISIWVLRCSHA